jgi:hypothetical protein
VENLNDQAYGLTFTITSSTNTPSGCWKALTEWGGGRGFNVSGNQIQNVNIIYEINPFGQKLFLGNMGFYSPQLVDFISGESNDLRDSTSTNSLVFSPAAPAPSGVPSPLPLFGAAAAFGWSRQLRRRIKTAA